MKNKSNVIKSFEDEIRRAKLRLSRCEEDYNQSIKSRVRFYLKYGFTNKDLVQRENETYLKFCKAYIEVYRLEDKLYLVKGTEVGSKNE